MGDIFLLMKNHCVFDEKKFYSKKITDLSIILTLRRPLRRKMRMRRFFDISKAKESSFF